jgi:hypothetical protein
MQNDYDLCVAYRIYPRVSKIPPVYTNDKLKLSELCLRSFKKSLGNLRVKMFVLLDNCPEEYSQLFLKYFNKNDLELINLPGVGNNKTFEMQIKILAEQNFSENVYLAEDDYFYLPNEFYKMLEFLHSDYQVDFITPYDHLDYYISKLHKYPKEVVVSANKHWMTAASTCLTFLTTQEVLRETASVFHSYTEGNLDVSLWLSLTKIGLNDFVGDNEAKFKEMLPVYDKVWKYCLQQILLGKMYKLWTPIPTIATHMESNFMSPAFEWDVIFNKEL